MINEQSETKPYIEETLAIPAWMLPYILGDDSDYLTEQDELALDRFSELLAVKAAKLRAYRYTIRSGSEGVRFTNFSDVPFYFLASDVVDIAITYFTE